MKSDREVLQELSYKTPYLHEMTELELHQLQSLLLTMYKDIAALCKQHDLTIMLGGGSVLGAVRHKGFIPWDDDLDILAPRKDYEELVTLVKQGALGENYEYSVPNKDTDSKSVWLKVYRKGTICQDVYASPQAPYPTGAYIDIFPIDSVPTTHMGQLAKGLVAKVLEFCSILVMYAQYPNEHLKQIMQTSRMTRRRYRMKLALGKLLGIIPHRKWTWWFDQWVKDSSEGKPLGTTAGRKYYNGEIFEREVYLEPIETEFEGLKVNIPHQYDIYLRNLYNDYMQLPPIEKRERHFITYFKA